jgi:hypothetical protein
MHVHSAQPATGQPTLLEKLEDRRVVDDHRDWQGIDKASTSTRRAIWMQASSPCTNGWAGISPPLSH